MIWNDNYGAMFRVVDESDDLNIASVPPNLKAQIRIYKHDPLTGVKTWQTEWLRLDGVKEVSVYMSSDSITTASIEILWPILHNITAKIDDFVIHDQNLGKL